MLFAWTLWLSCFVAFDEWSLWLWCACGLLLTGVFVVGCIDFLLLDNLVPDGGVFEVCVISDLSGNLIVLMWLVLLWF